MQVLAACIGCFIILVTQLMFLLYPVLSLADMHYEIAIEYIN
jgi:hypothetical protein